MSVAAQPSACCEPAHGADNVHHLRRGAHDAPEQDNNVAALDLGWLHEFRHPCFSPPNAFSKASIASATLKYPPANNSRISPGAVTSSCCLRACSSNSHSTQEAGTG